MKTSATQKSSKSNMRLYLISAIVALISAIYGVDKILDSGILNSGHIFDHNKLHALAIASIEQHGNNTRELVGNIIDTLRADDSIGPYLSVEEQWIFNNAGGAMGAMWIVHASVYPPYPLLPLKIPS